MVSAEPISRIYWWLDAQERRAIVRDKTTLKRAEEQLFLWTAVAVDSTEILTFYSSDTRCALDTFWFLRNVLNSCTNKPVIIGEKGP